MRYAALTATLFAPQWFDGTGNIEKAIGARPVELTQRDRIDLIRFLSIERGHAPDSLRFLLREARTSRRFRRIFMTGPFRFDPETPGGRFGRLIDRAKPLRFHFDGTPHMGFAGDTLASALLAGGVRLVGWSARRSRPRGLVGVGAEEPNAIVTLGDGGARTPTVPATMIDLEEGLVCRSQSRWRDSARLWGAAAERMKGLLPPLHEALLGRAAVSGHASHPEPHEHIHLSCDVLVAGGGIAGLAAALAASENGARVILADETARLGGQADLFPGFVENGAPMGWVGRTVSRLAGSERVILLTRTSVATLDRSGPAILYDRSDGGRIWFVQAKRVVIATGSTERPLLFAGNDRPGVMLSRAARAYALRYGVAPGKRGLVVVNNDDGYRTAELLKHAGVDVVKIADLRQSAESRAIDRAKTTGLPMRFGAGLARVGVDPRTGALASAELADFDADRRVRAVSELPCDFVLMSGGDAPLAQLYQQVGGRLVFDPAIGGPRPEGTIDGAAVIGAAGGSFALEAALEEGFTTGERFARETIGRAPKRRARPIATGWEDAPPDVEILSPAVNSAAGGDSHFVDFAADLSVADLERAIRAGCREMDHLALRLGLGRGADQGRLALANAMLLTARFLGCEPEDLKPASDRTPMSPDLLAGPRRGLSLAPVRRTPLQEWHEANGAIFENEGPFLRPLAYPQPDESADEAALREGRATRSAAGLADISTLARIEIVGRDAAAFLERAFVMSGPLAIGRRRRGLALDGNGAVIDDAVLVRSAETRFLVCTTAEDAHVRLERLARKMGLHAFVIPVGEASAHLTLIGPQARAILRRAGADFDVSAEAFPPSALQTGKIAGCPVQALRGGATGETSFEILSPASFAPALWRALLESGRPLGLAAIGSRALAALRLEAGVPSLGREIDGTVTADELGLGHLTARRDRSPSPVASAPERSVAGTTASMSLVGLIIADGRQPLPVGSLIVSEQRPHRVEGRVTSNCQSPSYGRWLALALLERGAARIGAVVPLVAPNGEQRWAHVRPPQFLPPAPANAGDPSDASDLVEPQSVIDEPAPQIVEAPTPTPTLVLPPNLVPDGIMLRLIDGVDILDLRLSASDVKTRVKAASLLADVSLTVLPLSAERLLVVAPSAEIERVAPPLRAALDGGAAAVSVVGDGWVGLTLSGPNAEAVLVRASDADLFGKDYSPGRMRRLPFGGVETILRLRALGRDFAAEIWIPRSYARWVADRLIEIARGPRLPPLWRPAPPPPT